jgi:fido (protein-threonine AMPylation protein)
LTFDPFGDFETRGYLRNIARTKDAKIIRQLEHSSFTTGLDAAFAKLEARKRLTYDDVLGTHQILFEAVYPWAGQDRMANAPGPTSSAAASNTLLKRAKTGHSCGPSRRDYGASCLCPSFS